MEQITFPGLELNLTISSIAFTLFGVNVYWYAVLMTFAIALGFIMLVIIRKNNSFGIKNDDIFDAILYTVPISLISARAYYVIFNFDVFKGNLLSILNFRTGGMAIYGGVIGGIVTLIVFCKKRKINILDMLDYMAPALALGQSIGRWGNFFNVEAYGTETLLLWRMGIMENGTYKEVHPTFLYESLVTLFLFILLTFLTKKRKYSGQITYIYLFVYGAARFFIELLRTDSLMFYNIRVSAALSLLICVVICSILCKKHKKHKKMQH